MPKPSVELFANGKIILSAEYFVLHGAKALALPVQFGQSLIVTVPVSCHPEYSEGSVPTFSWQSIYNNNLWFSADIDSQNFNIVKTSDQKIAETLVLLLKTIRELNPHFQIEPGTEVKTVLDFHPQWGLGSSSTLVANLAQWAKVDPFVLNEMVFHGSGFDIACANAKGPIFYTKGEPAEPVILNYSFADQLFLVYSGKKKATKNEILGQNLNVSENGRVDISALSEQFANCKRLGEFQELIQIHEKKVGDLIGQTPIQQRLFPDFNGSIKSLGAWGGDFLLVATELDFDQVKKYFSEKGMTTVFRWKEMVGCRDF